MKLLEFFARRPVFTYKEFASFLDSDGPRSVKTRDSLLAHHTKTGRILRVRRGLYASIPLGISTESWPVDTFLLAGNMSDDSVLAYHTALEFHGKAHSVWNEFFFLTGKDIRSLTFRGSKFKAVRFPKALVREGREFFAVDQAERIGLSLRVTSLERTLVDVSGPTGTWRWLGRNLEVIGVCGVLRHR